MKHKNKIINLSIFIFTIALIVSAVFTYINITSNRVTPINTAAEIKSSHDYQVISRVPTKIWLAGTIFEQGMLAYFYAAMPIVAVKPNIQITETNNSTVNGTLISQVMLRAVNDKSEAYWSFKMNQTSEETFQLTEEQPSFTAKEMNVDPSWAYELASQMAEELKFQTSQFQLVVISNITLNGSIQNNPIEKTISQELPITLQASSFTLGKTEDIASKISIRQNIPEPSLQTTLYEIFEANYILISIILISLLCILILLRMKSKTSTKLMLDHRKYRDWITEGTVELTSQYLIYIHTLQGLVDLAIDLDKRVIFDSAATKYYVLAEDMIYVFDGKRKYTVNDNKQHLGKLLLNQGLLMPEQLEMGLYYQNKIGYRLGESLIALGFIDETTLYSTLAAQSQLDYYDAHSLLNFDKLHSLDNKNINKAKALMAIPLGMRADGALVIACSEFSREGIVEELEKIFGSNIHMVATRPSFIHQCFEHITINEKNNTNQQELNLLNHQGRPTNQEINTNHGINTNQSIHINKGINMFNENDAISGINSNADISSNADINSLPELFMMRLTKKEREDFIASYYRGSMVMPLFLQALGYLDKEILQQIPKHEGILPWLVSKHIITGEVANLMKGLDKTIKSMEWTDRQEKQFPRLTKLLISANYITAESEEWINRELGVQKLELEHLLIDNFLVSQSTLEQAKSLLDALEKIVNSL